MLTFTNFSNSCFVSCRPFLLEERTDQYWRTRLTKIERQRRIATADIALLDAITPQHSKDIIMGSLQDCHSTVRVVFASVAMGMGIDLHGVDTIIHYGAPSSIEDYFQASGRRGQSGDSAYSIVYRTSKDCQTGDWIAKKEPAFHDQE